MVKHEKIAQLMDEQGITCQALADEVGVSTAMVSMIRRGLKTPSVDVLVRIAVRLKVGVQDLVEEK